MKILVTGGSGFIGSNFIKYVFSKFSDSEIINLDKYSNPNEIDNLEEFEDKDQYKYINGDFANSKIVENILEKYNPNYIVNFAAETHVDKSILFPKEFIETNILGTFRFLESVNNYFQHLQDSDKNQFKFIHISTDEVYGSLTNIENPFQENNKYYPNSPYSASKASSDHLVRAFHKTYNLPTVISNCSNNYGPYQSLEKFIPLIIYNALNKKNIPIYGNGEQIRDWLYVEDHCDAITNLLFKAKPGEVFNIGGSNEYKNIDIVKIICNILDSLVPLAIDNKKESYCSLITFVKDRPGHDTRYAVNSSKIKNELSWEAKTKFEVGIRNTINWYLNNRDWVISMAGEKYIDWIKKQY
tara:strand:- start:897 stop:1964 length:1068 start_codon:yes stop_codon:yes gene_type:complete